MDMIERILEILAQRRMKQGELERLVGLSANRISKWKNNVGEPSAKEIYRIARALGVSANYLVEGKTGEEDLTPDEGYLLRLIRDLDYETRDAVQVLARRFAFRDIKVGDVLTDDYLVREQSRDAKQDRQKRK